MLSLKLQDESYTWDQEQIMEAVRLLASTRSGVPHLYRDLVPPIYSQMAQLSAGDLCLIVSTYACPMAYHQELFAGATEFIWEHRQNLSASQVSQVVQAYAEVQHYHDDEDFFNGLAKRALEQIEDFPPGDLSQLLSSLANLGFYHEPVFAAALARVSRTPDQFSLRHVSDIARSCAVVQHGWGDFTRYQVLVDHLRMRLRNLRTSTDGHKLTGSLKRGGRECQETMATNPMHTTAMTQGAREPASIHLTKTSDARLAYVACLVTVFWSCSMLGLVHQPLFREVLAALEHCQPSALQEEQLARLFAALVKIQELSHPIDSLYPGLAESISVWNSLVSRPHLRALTLPPALQVMAFTSWMVAQYQQTPRLLYSWKYRDPLLLTARGLRDSVTQVVRETDLPAPQSVVTLDGLLEVPLTFRYQGSLVCWEVLDPACFTRNPPYRLLADAAARLGSLRYRGWRVKEVPFYEWAELSSLEERVHYLSHKLEKEPWSRL